MAGKSKSNEIRIERIYDAPVKLVWDAWTDPKKAAKWWGPRGFTITTHSKDLKAGGIWHYTMHGPDGVDYPNKTLYHEVEKYSKLVYDHGGNDERAPLFRVTVLFTENKGKTKMEMTMALATAEAAAQTKKFIKAAGGNGTWDRLAEFLEQESSGKEKFFINRTFEAPIEVIFDLWTKPEHFSKWLPPVGLRMEILKGEIKAGARVFYLMTDDEDTTFHGRIEYLKVTHPSEIVYTQEFCDENEKLSVNPFDMHWPKTIMSLVTLTEEEPGLTRVTVTWEPCGDISREELESFIKERGGMTQGWTGSFDKLEELVGKAGQV